MRLPKHRNKTLSDNTLQVEMHMTDSPKTIRTLYLLVFKGTVCVETLTLFCILCQDYIIAKIKIFCDEYYFLIRQISYELYEFSFFNTYF